jgi:hemerythrin-like domain-containing protein
VKRSESLKSLSHEHHHALFIAKRLRDEGEQALEAFLTFWRTEGRIHFQIEEEVLLPGSGLAGPGRDPDVARMLDEHLAIRRRVASVLEGQTSAVVLGELGQALTDHVRFEERELFPRIEADLPPEELERLGAQLVEAEAEAQQQV